ncbi:hypothetical protein E2C01_059570 [Portunus trituberculatus]|uniref:Uncharacterized protein n=1 Tax=Portunus trituberculatus TaxID=210409 RepID=A0A5B7H679_PORTR|nr:hypothetical protein [Portunus trituberculatus]
MLLVLAPTDSGALGHRILVHPWHRQSSHVLPKCGTPLGQAPALPGKGVGGAPDLVWQETNKATLG